MQVIFRRSVTCGSLLLSNGSRKISVNGGRCGGGVRFYPAIGSNELNSSGTAAEPEKSVFISQSTDAHTNLALEDWLYRNFDFEKHRVLLLWQNDPYVVIGQNPWSEVDIDRTEGNGMSIARRNSGGGCVYHDKGNVNCTFFSPRNGYDRKSNLEVICRALNRQFGIKTEITQCLDVKLEGYKISGTASKLGKNAYHHCTVLADADRTNLSRLRDPNTEGIEYRATKSVKSPGQNLKHAHDTVSIGKTLSSIGYEFLRTTMDGNDGGAEMIRRQRGFQMINPTNDWFPGLDSIKSELKSWAWDFGKTPEFTLQKEYQLGQDGSTLEPVNLQLNIQVKQGLIESASLELPAETRNFVDQATLSDLSSFVAAIKMRQFHGDIISTFEELLFKKNVTNNKPMRAFFISGGSG